MKKQLKISGMKPAHVYLVCAFLILIVTTKIILSRILRNSETMSNEDSSFHQFNEIKLSSNLLLPDSNGGSDPFIKGDFLDKKFLHLVSLTHLAVNPVSSLKETTSQPTTDTDFSYLLNELMIVINVKNFYSRSLSCKEIAAIQMLGGVHETSSKLLHSGMYRNTHVMVETVKPNIDQLVGAGCGSSDSDHSPANLDRCFLLKNRFLLDESALLMQLPHGSIARMMGLCVQHGNTKERLDASISSAGVVLVREAGSAANIEKLKMMSWDDRLKICMELLNLAVYFTRSPLGSIRLESWNPENFILNFENNKILLNNVDKLAFTEPACKTEQDCYVDGINCGLKCIDSGCAGYNMRRNLHELNHAFLSPLLRYNVPQAQSENILNLLVTLNNLKLTAYQVLVSLQKLAPKQQQEEQLDVEEDRRALDDNPAVLSMQKLPDGSQVDSSDQHENKVAINDVNPVLVKKPEPDGVELIEDGPMEIHEYEHPGDANDFRKIENADFPGRYDYFCQGSRAEWGCVMSLRSVDEAKQNCLKDDKCKAFVSIPHLRKEGWFIVILKSDNTNPVDHAGTTVFIREHSSGAPVSHELPPDDAVEAKKQEDCFNDVIKAQSKLRHSLEESLMKTCGWAGMTDEDWANGVKNGRIADASSFKPARGKLASGGQMDIVVEIDSKTFPAVFLAKRGPEEFDVSQLAVYQVDRMLGFYKTVPAVERLLSVSELSDAGFPVDVGGNQFDKFRSLKQSDGSLLGVVVPKVRERVSIEHYISVPRLSGITNAVTPFNKKQWNDMEYLMLGFLAAIPFSTKGHQGVKGRLLHLKTEEAFLHQIDDYISYFYNCQFPAHVIEVLRHSEARRCDFGSAVRTRLIDQSSPDISKLLQASAKKLLDLVDQCVTRFGKQVVLYDANLSSGLR